MQPAPYSKSLLPQGRRLMGTEHLTHAAEACGFAVAQLDMAALPFAQQLQVRHWECGALKCLNGSTESSACLTTSTLCAFVNW